VWGMTASRHEGDNQSNQWRSATPCMGQCVFQVKPRQSGTTHLRMTNRSIIVAKHFQSTHDLDTGSLHRHNDHGLLRACISIKPCLPH